MTDHPELFIHTRTASAVCVVNPCEGFPLAEIDAVAYPVFDVVAAEMTEFVHLYERSVMIGMWWMAEAEEVALAWTRTAPGAMLCRHYGLRDDALDGGF